jgi:hypothetical protein
VKKLLPKRALARPLFGLVGVILLLLVISEEALSNPVDTLYLPLKFACPLKVGDLKLVDFDQDGISEILVVFYSDSGRAGILDPVTQTWVWQGPGFNGHLYTVAAGDRNSDGSLDIVCGGQRSDTSIGYTEIFDGPNFDSACTLSGFNDKVLSAAVSARGLDSLPQIFLGTHYYSHGYYEHEMGADSWSVWSGRLYVLDGQSLAVEDVGGGASVIEMLVRDINGDAYEELFLGMRYQELFISTESFDYALLKSFVNLTSSGDYHNFTLYDIPWWPGPSVSFDALEVGSFDGGASHSIIASGHWDHHEDWIPRYKLSCWNASTTELEWTIGWEIGTYVTDLAVCGFSSQQTDALCVAYRYGLMEFRSGTDGSILAVVPPLHPIYHLEVGNLDQDSLVEMCVASGDSLYVYDLQGNYRPLVSNIPNQTITEGESFTSISLDDYVKDLWDHDSTMVWSHSGEVELLVDITDRVATVSVPNPEWNGAETIWFKACDPEGLCDSSEATFTVTAVNDAPVVTAIPNQTIVAGGSFTSIGLDDYVTDPDDQDSIITWTHWGEKELVVELSDRVATITVPNLEWSGSETIWFKACDTGGVCDSNEATFTVRAENDTPVVSEIPDQTIATGESFAPISLDDCVIDPDDDDSVIVWSHWGENELLVNIIDHVAAITVLDPSWSGVETIWFKACDPAGLCDSNQATFTLHPVDFCLFQNYPNPFNPQTNIRFTLPVACKVTLTIYNILGQRIRTFEKRCLPATHTFSWDGKNSSGEEAASGVYLYKLSAGNHQEIRKMVLLR